MKNRIYTVLGIVQCFVALGALPAGYSMITKPDGSGLGIPVEILENSPFDDFFIPGLFLLIVNGLANVLGAYYSFSRHRLSAITGLILGILLLLWISVQVYFTGWVSFLQPLFFAVALIEIILAAGIYAKYSKELTKVA